MFARLALAIVTMTISGTALAADPVYSTSSQLTAAQTGSTTETTAFGLAYSDDTGGPTYNSVALADGVTLGVNANTVAQSGTGFAQFTNGYSGDVLYNASPSETITFASSVSVLGFDIAPDLGIAAELGLPNSATLTITLSNGQSTGPISLANYDAGDSYFFGFQNLDAVTALTITISGNDGFGNPIAGFAIGDIFDVPEPASLAAFGVGLGALAMIRRRRAV